jgi:N-acetylmuramoyl-L-alanine amidase
VPAAGRSGTGSVELGLFMIKKTHLIAVTTLITLAVPLPAEAAGRYTVKWGDTLTWIARDHRISIDRLASVNHLDPNGVLVEGTILRIPRARDAGARSSTAGTTTSYTVQWGDTLSGIAARHGTTVDNLAAMNRLNPAAILLAGRTLRVPAGSAAWGSGGSSASVPGSIDRWSAHYGVDPHLVRAIAWMESGFQPHVVSPAGARGVMQVMPATWRFVEGLIGSRVPHTPDGNVRIGVAYLHHLLNLYGGRERLAVAAYYQGPGAVASRGLLPETALYVADVLALRTRL